MSHCPTLLAPADVMVGLRANAKGRRDPRAGAPRGRRPRASTPAVNRHRVAGARATRFDRRRPRLRACRTRASPASRGFFGAFARLARPIDLPGDRRRAGRPGVPAADPRRRREPSTSPPSPRSPAGCATPEVLSRRAQGRRDRHGAAQHCIAAQANSPRRRCRGRWNDCTRPPVIS